jgi:hypothetical protein
VVDAGPKFIYQLWVWVTTLVHCAGVPSTDLYVHIVRRESPSMPVEEFLRGECIPFSYIEPFGDGRFCNKLEQLDTPALRAREFAVLCDTDLAFLSALDPWIGLGTICAKEVDFPNPPIELLEPLYRRAGFDRFPDRKRCSFSDAETYLTNCNGGIYIFRTTIFDDLLPRWKRWVFWVLEQRDLLERYTLHVSQISFSMAVWEMGESIVPLPKIVNFPTHVPVSLYDPHNDVPLVLHYHDRVNDDGGLGKVGVSLIDRRIARVNETLSRIPKPLVIERALRTFVTERSASSP